MGRVLKSKRKRREGPRWWHNWLLNFPPPVDVSDTELHMEHCLWEKPREELSNSYTSIKKHPHQDGQERLTYTLHNRASGTAPLTREGSTQLHFIKIGSPWEAKGLENTFGVPTFKASLEGRAPNHLVLMATLPAFTSPTGCSKQRGRSQTGTTLPNPLGLYTQAQHRGDRHNVHLPVSLWKELNSFLSQLLPEGPASHQPALGATHDPFLWDALPGLGMPATTGSH